MSRFLWPSSLGSDPFCGIACARFFAMRRVGAGAENPAAPPYSAQAHGRGPVYPMDLGGLRLPGLWRGLCSFPGIVLSRPWKLSAIALVVTLVAATSSTLIAFGAQHEVCAMHHECDQAPRITQCCCGHATDASQGGPVESRVQLTVDLSPLPVSLTAGIFADTSGTGLQTHTSPPSVFPPDLATRFAPLLI